jgi:hypothetical protein
MSENNGPDGCAIFYNNYKFDLVNWDKHILDVYGSKGNQVSLTHARKPLEKNLPNIGFLLGSVVCDSSIQVDLKRVCGVHNPLKGQKQPLVEDDPA